jgi:hypothetical protein
MFLSFIRVFKWICKQCWQIFFIILFFLFRWPIGCFDGLVSNARSRIFLGRFLWGCHLRSGHPGGHDHRLMLAGAGLTEGDDWEERGSRALVSPSILVIKSHWIATITAFCCAIVSLRCWIFGAWSTYWWLTCAVSMFTDCVTPASWSLKLALMELISVEVWCTWNSRAVISICGPMSSLFFSGVCLHKEIPHPIWEGRQMEKPVEALKG